MSIKKLIRNKKVSEMWIKFNESILDEFGRILSEEEKTYNLQRLFKFSEGKPEKAIEVLHLAIVHNDIEIVKHNDYQDI